MQISMCSMCTKIPIVKVNKWFWKPESKGWWENIYAVIALPLNRLLNRFQVSLKSSILHERFSFQLRWQSRLYGIIRPHVNIANETNTYVLIGTTEPTSLHSLTCESEHAHTGCVSGSVRQAADLRHARCLLWPMWQGVCLQICPSLCKEVEVIHTHSHWEPVAWDDYQAVLIK